MIAVGQGKEEKQHKVPHLIGLSHREYLGILYSMYATSDRFLARDTVTQMYPMTSSIFIGTEHSYCASYSEALCSSCILFTENTLQIIVHLAQARYGTKTNTQHLLLIMLPKLQVTR